VTVTVHPASGPDATFSPFTYFQQTGSTWTQLPGGAHDVAAGGGSTFVLGNDAVSGGWDVWKLVNGGWSPFTGGLVDIAVGPDGNPWGINSGHQIWRYQNGAWAQLPGAANEIAVGADGQAFVLGTNAVNGGWGIWQWVSASSSWTSFPGGGGATHIAAGGFGSGNTPWVTNSSNQIWAYNSGAGWRQLPGSAVDIAASRFSVWVLGSATTGGGYVISYYDGTGWTSIPGGATELAIGDDTLPVAVNSSGQIWRRS
jgi:hypothetical protein